MAVGPYIKKNQPTTGYNGSGITAGTPYATTPQGLAAGGGLQARPMQFSAPQSVDPSGNPIYIHQGQPASQGYDGSGINPNGMYTGGNQRPASLDGMFNYPTIPPGNIPPTTPAPAPGSGLPQLNLPGINGQQYVATANGYSGGVPANVPFPAGPAPFTAPTVPGYTPQPVSNAPSGSGTQVPVGPNYSYTPQSAPAAPGGASSQPVPTLGNGWQVPDQYASINTVQDFMGNLLDSGNPYMSNAIRRGLETAGSRGLLNSSIASGAAQRSAIENAQPLLQEAMNTLNAREGMKFTQGENALDRTQQERLQTLHDNFTGSENAADRTMSERLQTLAQNFQGSENAQDRNAAQVLQQLAQQFQTGENALDRTQQERILGLTQNFQGTQADMDRQLQSLLTTMGINADLTNSNANRSMQLQLQREGNAFNSEQSQLDRTQGVNNMLLQNQLGLQNMTAENFFRQQMQNDATMQQDWLSSQDFTRQFNAALSMIPISNAADLNNYLMQAAINEPEVFTPQVMSGMSQFFNQNLTALLAQYFPQGLNP